MIRHATWTRLGDWWEDVKAAAAVVGTVLLVITAVGGSSIGLFGLFIYGWSGRWPW